MPADTPRTPRATKAAAKSQSSRLRCAAAVPWAEEPPKSRDTRVRSFALFLLACMRPRRIYSAITTSGRDASTLPYNSSVSYFTVTVNVSDLPDSFKSFGTRHEYPQVPSQPKGIVPSATFLPDESATVTTGSRESGRS